MHIGESSAGWLFVFQKQDCWANYKDVKSIIKTATDNHHIIIDEYDRVIDYDKFIELVENKQSNEHCINNPNNFIHCNNIDGYRFMSGDFR